MASYKIEWKQSAKKELRKLGKTVIPGIVNAVECLASEARPTGSRKLQGSEHLYRVRVGDYRIVYSIENKVLLIEVIRVGHRKDIYKKLT